ncbi:MAG: 1-acyl-sn-glycerol-3-phosphate acyltransferase [Sphingomonadaceae bacterium]|nr:1-acyl-sn-glycerol-3-phosphate acyltransferase [Sphingomonadaceae bacterium]
MASPSTARIDAPVHRLPRLAIIGWARVAARLLTALAWLFVCVPMHYVTQFLMRGSPWPKYFLGGAARIFGARVRVTGQMPRRDMFIIANHVSWLDILVLAGVSGTAYVAKAEVRASPLLRWLADLNRTIYVARHERMNVGNQVAMVREALAETRAVTVFPEATTSDGHSLLPFKTSLLAVLEPPPPGISIQPVYIDYGDEASTVAWVGEEPGLHNVLRILARRRPIETVIHFLQPFAGDGIGGRKLIASESRRRMEEVMHRTRH